MDKLIYTIMASYLGEYPGCSKNREEKFIRAVDSFLNNTYQNKKLIIVSDGCAITKKLHTEKYKGYEDIIYLSMDKQMPFSGSVRNKGLEYAKNGGVPDDIICYLDTDDRFGSNHLKHVVDNFGENDFVIYDTHRFSDSGWHISKVAMKACHIGTSSFAHKLKLDISWPDGYGHDWELLNKMSQNYKYSEIPIAEYYIHHVPNADS